MHSPNGTTTINGFDDPTLRVWRQEQFAGLIDVATGEIGRVVSSEKEPAGAHEFFFWAADDALTLDVGHIVVAFSEEAAVIGVVDTPRRYSDLRTFLDDYFDRHVEIALAADTPTPRPEILVFTVRVLATKHRRPDVQSNRPVITGPVYFATSEAIEYALGTHGFSGAKIPALMHTNGNYVRTGDGAIATDDSGLPKFQRTPLYLDEEYLLGPEAGHANWTGQSGLATKTSHALFLISSVFQTLQAEGGKTVAALMFNVKGPDLLWLDKPAQPEPEWEDAYAAASCRGLTELDLEAYAAFGLEPAPFENTRIFAPFRPGHIPPPTNGTVMLDGFDAYKALNTERNQQGETDRVYPILWSLETALWYPHKVFDFNDLDDKLMGFIYEIREMGIGSLAKLQELFTRIDNDLAESGEDTWRGHHKATIRKAQNRFKSVAGKLGGLLADHAVSYGGASPRHDDPFNVNELRVIDISACNTVAQELIVSSTINRIWKRAEANELGVDKLIVFVDELNKYAPAGGDGGLRDTLVDIAARGRHLNVVLLGAQQFRSKVDSEILGNCGTSLYGRVGDEEIINAAYRSISETQKQELLGLPKGRMLVRHAHFRAPLFGTFPHPPTIPGAFGQRVFNGALRPWDASVALHRTLRSLMGHNAPGLPEIRIETAGLDNDAIEQVRSQVESQYRHKPVTFGSNPWKFAQKQLRNATAKLTRT
jgi:hypothetical protein